MSIADHFDHTPDAGFVRTYDSYAARRQFQVSLVLIIVLTAAAFALGLMVRFDDSATAAQQPLPASVTQPTPAKSHNTSTSHDVGFAGRLETFRG